MQINSTYSNLRTNAMSTLTPSPIDTITETEGVEVADPIDRIDLSDNAIEMCVGSTMPRRDRPYIPATPCPSSPAQSHPNRTDGHPASNPHPTPPTQGRGLLKEALKQTVEIGRKTAHKVGETLRGNGAPTCQP